MARAPAAFHVLAMPPDDRRPGPRSDGDAGPIATFLAEDHVRLHALAARAVADPERVDTEAWQEFRRGLLRHIAMEEKVLFRAAAERLGHPVTGAAKLRRDHGFLAQLMTIAPTRAIIAEVVAVLGPHDALEEGPDGVYAGCEAALGDAAPEVLARMRALPPVRVAPYRRGTVH